MMGPPVVRLVPGLGLDGAAWRPTAESLPPAWSRGLDIALLPGYGERAARRADLRPAASSDPRPTPAPVRGRRSSAGGSPPPDTSGWERHRR